MYFQRLEKNHPNINRALSTVFSRAERLWFAEQWSAEIDTCEPAPHTPGGDLGDNEKKRGGKWTSLHLRLTVLRYSSLEKVRDRNGIDFTSEKLYLPDDPYHANYMYRYSPNILCVSLKSSCRFSTHHSWSLQKTFMPIQISYGTRLATMHPSIIFYAFTSLIFFQTFVLHENSRLLPSVIILREC